MTLHWWMHWFWVTALLTLHGSEPIIGAPQSEELQHMTTHTGIEPRPSEREPRAMYIPKPSEMPTKPENNATINTTDKDTNKQINNTKTNITIDVIQPSVEWTPALVADVNATSEENITTTSPSTTVADNATDPRNVTTPKRNLTRLQYKEDSVDGVSESRIVTEKPLSLETPFLQTRIPPVESFRRVEQEQGMDTGAIAGISFAALVLGALAGSTAFVLYRRRYLNKPQTLNDKCSNPDSSGYLDDSTVRDNSEEMYSLDNDSFLNSLEAMTIQNYWTDTVKHTKL